MFIALQVWGVKNGPYEFKPAPGPATGLGPASTSVDMLSPLDFPLSIGKRIEGSFVLQD